MDFLTTTVLVSSSTDPKTFGTGFVVYQDQERSYVVTCAHVVESIKKSGDLSQLQVGSMIAEVIALGKPDEIDLAVLTVPLILERKALPLQVKSEAGETVKVTGQSLKGAARIGKVLDGVLEEEVTFPSPGWLSVRGWQLSFQEKDKVEKGYSGGPVFVGERVVAVAAIEEKQGVGAFAVSINALALIWPEMPPELLRSISSARSAPTLTVQEKIKQVLSSRWSFAIGTGTVISFVILLIRLMGFLELWELAIYDHSLRMRPSESIDKRLAIIEATTKDLNDQRERNENGKGAISDVGLQEVLEKLSQEEFRPSVIALDLYRDFPEDPLRDTFNQFNKEGGTDLFLICEQSNARNKLGVDPPSGFMPEHIGFSNAILDEDGILRRQLVKSNPGKSRCKSNKSLAVAVAVRYLEKLKGKTIENDDLWSEKGDLKLPNTSIKRISTFRFGGYAELDSNGVQFLLNYRDENIDKSRDIDISQFQFEDVRFKFEDVRKGTIDAVDFKNRIVLIGITDRTEAVDYVQTPYGEMAGVVVHAHMISQIISTELDQRSQIQVWSFEREFLWILLWGLGGSIWGIWLISHRKSVVWSVTGLSLGCIIGCVAVYLIGTEGMKLYTVWIPILPPALSWTVAGIIVNIVYYCMKSLKVEHN
ncbi:MAG: CHASE2 domain-containing protein [Spirulina sp. SIO3F2]|nr:CHASE2 domain-containing protein [Spirulina sp. SIO3F2]